MPKGWDKNKWVYSKSARKFFSRKHIRGKTGSQHLVAIQVEGEINLIKTRKTCSCLKLPDDVEEIIHKKGATRITDKKNNHLAKFRDNERRLCNLLFDGIVEEWNKEMIEDLIKSRKNYLLEIRYEEGSPNSKNEIRKANVMEGLIQRLKIKSRYSLKEHPREFLDVPQNEENLWASSVLCYFIVGRSYIVRTMLYNSKVHDKDAIEWAMSHDLRGLESKVIDA